MIKLHQSGQAWAAGIIGCIITLFLLEAPEIED